MRAVFAAAALAVLFFAAAPARASSCCCVYDVQVDRGLMVRGQQVGIDTEALGFDRQQTGVKGFAVGGVLRGEIELPAEFALRLKVPLYTVSTQYGRSQGAGDLGVALKRRIFGGETEPFEITAALAAEVPIPFVSDPHNGISMGHLLLIPVLAAGTAVGPVGLQLETAYLRMIPIGEHSQHNHDTYVSPHDNEELNVTFTGGWRLSTEFWLQGFVSGVATLTPYPTVPIGSRLTAGPALLWRSGDIALRLAAELPLTANRTHDWRTVVGGSYRF